MLEAQCEPVMLFVTNNHMSTTKAFISIPTLISKLTKIIVFDLFYV